MAADEYIASRLAKEFGLTGVDLELAKINGQVGIVSLKHPSSTLCDWNAMSSRYSNPIAHVVRPHRLLKVFVFDVWIANIDRNGRNIIFYPVGRRGQYDFYLIDHGLSLLGSITWTRVKWNHAY